MRWILILPVFIDFACCWLVARSAWPTGVRRTWSRKSYLWPLCGRCVAACPWLYSRLRSPHLTLCDFNPKDYMIWRNEIAERTANFAINKKWAFWYDTQPLFIQNCPIDLIKKKSLRSLHFVPKWHILGIPDGTKSILRADFVTFF